MRCLLVAVLMFTASSSFAQNTSPAPIPAKDAPSKMSVPEGFKVTLFAGEPDIVQPIAFTFDDRGRMWVVECLSYPQWEGGPVVAGQHPKSGDRVTILEDTDGDGTFNKKTVFMDKGVNLTGIELGFGGVFLTSVPNLIFVADADGDDKPDGPPKVLLDGFDLKARHNVVNALRWGPDGWLYGCNGILSNAKIGKPGTADAQRVKMDCGVWRYHPTKEIVEWVASGTTNPWGLDFDEYGEMFITNCVIQHLFHVIPGGHYERMFGQDVTPNTYGLMPSCVDYIHWAGGHWTESRGGQGAHSDAGGGHAHSGAMVYLGDQFPAEYRNSLMTCNIHGSRLNRDKLERGKMSAYAAKREKDFMFANDPWFRGIAVQQGPDGSVYVSDWTDTGECHNYVEVDRRNGRIYRTSYGNPKPFGKDLSKLSDVELARLHLSTNEFIVRHARRLLQERAAAKKLDRQVIEMFQQNAFVPGNIRVRLRAIWALYAIGELSAKQLFVLMGDVNDHVRAWAVRLACENPETSTELLGHLTDLAAKERSPFVRLHLASSAQRIAPNKRAGIVLALSRSNEPVNDPSLNWMIWYAAEPMVASSPNDGIRLINESHIPLIRENVARRLAGTSANQMDLVVANLSKMSEADSQLDVLKGILEVLKGQRQAPLPPSWSAVYDELRKSKSPEVRQKSMHLAAVFDDEKALTSMHATVIDPKADRGARLMALDAIVFKQKPDTLALLQGLLNEPSMRQSAIKHLAGFEDAKTPLAIVELYAKLSDAEKLDAIATLASRPTFALSLLDAIEKGAIPGSDVSAFTVRQLQGLKNASLNQRIAKVWGEVRPASAESKTRIAKFKKDLSSDFMKKADVPNGRALFAKNCASCHRLFDDGGKIGPELTGSQRSNLDYVLENVLDPSAVLAREYSVTAFEMKNGRVLNGIVAQENDKAVTVQTQNEVVIVPKNEIAERVQTKVSMMPEGMFDKMKLEEVRDLMAYLASTKQVPLPKMD